MPRAFGEIRAAVVGTGFVGAVHVDALRRLGVEVAGVVASTPKRAAATGLGPVYESLDAVLADPRVDVVHLATPNHLHYPQARRVLESGKHVVCEKPLAVSAEQSADVLGLAERAGVVHCTNFNLRFYPQVLEAQARVRAGELGAVWNVHGGYLQDWLLRPGDWNWRLDPEQGGELRAVGDIGSHWLDIVQFVTGLRVEAVCADLATTVPVRARPAAEVRTFAESAGGGVEVPVATEDLANVLLRFVGGARGALVVSQVSAGRKNSLRFEVDGSESAVAWDQERPEELWLGRRDAPNERLLRNPALLRPASAAHSRLPAGHAEGWAETFRELYRAVYTAVAAGGPPAEPDYPTFADGHWEQVLGEAIARSHRERRWVEVTT